jgi:hypothetical protein
LYATLANFADMVSKAENSSVAFRVRSGIGRFGKNEYASLGISTPCRPESSFRVSTFANTSPETKDLRDFSTSDFA